ncbi:MAG: cytochrome b/b6 domain-containing protein [Pseudomonadota bacterium]
MALTNSAARYGAVSKSFHWITALLIFALIPLGIIANGLPFETSDELALKALWFSVHKTLGVTVFFVALARILWAIIEPKPAGLHPERRLETFAAETVHWLLYGSLLLVPLSGWVHHAATTGFAPIWWPFGQNLPFVPKNEDLASAAAGLHIVFERVLVLSLFLHIAGALKHHFLDRDATLKRMLPGRTEAAAPDPKRHQLLLPVAGAIALWGGALVMGGALGLYERHGTTVEAAELSDVESAWQVQEGTLAITVVQMGSDVEGQFADWTAAIDFDVSVESGKAGSVDVAISIGSLTLGSVTDQAMGTDFFNADAFPTATFVADILRTEAGYEAQGTVSIKEHSMPVTLPFELTVTDGVAQMSGSTSLDRRNYGIGDNQSDAASLGFDVVVNVALTANLAE